MQDRGLSVLEPYPQAKGSEKKLSRKNRRNALKRLDSDERIQGNPRQSNAHKLGFSQPNGRDPRKTKRLDREGSEGKRPDSRHST
jgi:hypothetical protein